jgi:hypothetical protein
MGDPFTIVEGLEIYNLLGSSGTSKAIAVEAGNCVVRSCLIHDIGASGYGIYSHEGNGSFGAVIQNNIVYNVGGRAISNYQNLIHKTGAKIVNNTVFGCGVGIYAKGTRADFTEEDTVLNNISIGNATDYDLSLVDVYADYNAGSLGTVPSEGTHNLETTVTEEFISTEPGNIDLHLREGASSINSGFNIGGEIIPLDVDGENRTENWDIGAGAWQQM